MRKFFYTLFILPLLLLSCGEFGGSEAGNPPNRSVTGNLDATTNSSTNFLKSHADTCEADLVVATDSAGNSTQADANTDCSFDLQLQTGNAYEVDFFLNDEFVAFLVMMNDDSNFESPVMVVSEGDASINLGRITIIDFMAFPENQPASQNDRDKDGTFDFDDDDDDDDGRSDRQERDCDLDGFHDDFDDFFSNEFDCEEEDDNSPFVVDVNPWDDEGFVGLDEPVQILFSCDIDADTVNATTFQVVDPNGTPITCNYQVNNDVATCEHDGDLFTDDTEYTAIISGIQCNDSQTLPNVSWSWNTGADLD